MPFGLSLTNCCMLLFTFSCHCRTNFLRLCVWKVTQRSAGHLEKIMNIDEVVKRLFSVTHSNDPTARALALRYIHVFMHHQLCMRSLY